VFASFYVRLSASAKAVDDGRDTTILIDGTPLIFRSYFATPKMTTQSGTPSNAVFGYTRYIFSPSRSPALFSPLLSVSNEPSSLFKLLKELKADHVGTPVLRIQFTNFYLNLLLVYRTCGNTLQPFSWTLQKRTGGTKNRQNTKQLELNHRMYYLSFSL
jgi:hypothetical protein